MTGTPSRQSTATPVTHAPTAGLDTNTFLADFAAMSRHGATPAGGVHREAATRADADNRNWFEGLVQGYGATVHHDAIGNEFALWELVPGAPYVLVGSHLDSQPFGGRYDGAYGVLAGAHACASFAAAVRAGQASTRYNVACVAWFNEEGSRFEPSMMGSSVFTGKASLDDMYAITDRSGITVREALLDINGIGEFQFGIGPDADEEFTIVSYAEIHIEQGKSMWQDGHTIGLVESTWAARKYDLVIHGYQAHTGSTLLPDRRDAMYGAAMVICAIREIGEKYCNDEHTMVTSCGELMIVPNSPVVVAQRADLLVDLRCDDESTLIQADEEFRQRLDLIATQARVHIERRAAHGWAAQQYSPAGVQVAEKVVQDLGLTYTRTRTLAGHDSTNVKDVVPTIMLFVPSVDGITHNEHEYTTDDDMIAGLRVFRGVVAELANGVLT